MQMAGPMEEDADEAGGDKFVTPEKMREEQAKELDEDEEDDNTIHGIVMGANENNFLMRGAHIDVLRNVGAGAGGGSG